MRRLELRFEDWQNLPDLLKDCQAFTTRLNARIFVESVPLPFGIATGRDCLQVDQRALEYRRELLPDHRLLLYI
jgi:hypothetical protein